MICLFSSNATARYKSDAVTILAQPRDGVVRFRYHRNHIPQPLRPPAERPSQSWWQSRGPLSPRTQVVIVYAEGAESAEGLDPEVLFKWYPLRICYVVALEWDGVFATIDLRCGEYLSYGLSGGDPNKDLAALRSEIEKLPCYPLPQVRGTKGMGWEFSNGAWQRVPYVAGKSHSQGYFVTDLPREFSAVIQSFAAPEDRAHEAWQNTIDVVFQSSTFSTSPCFRVTGLYALRVLRERLVRPKVRLAQALYKLRPGKAVTMKLAWYHPARMQLPPFAINIDAPTEIFSGVSPKVVRVDSRYNEERITLATKRVLDHVLSPVIVSASPRDATAPSKSVSPCVQFLVQVALPWWFAPLVFLLFAIGSFLLSFDADWWKHWSGHPSVLAWISRSLGALSLASAAYLVYRKAPIG